MTDLTQVINDLTPYLIAASPYLQKAGEKAVEEVSKQLSGVALEKVKNIWTKLRPEIEAKPTAREALALAGTSPEDSDVQASVRLQLKTILQNDHSLAQEISTLWQEALETGINLQSGRNVSITGNVSQTTIVTGDGNQIKS